MRINNNIMAMNSHRVYGINSGNLGRNVERLSSGFRVNRSADDAAGLAISEKMRSQIRGLNQASRNSLDGVSLIQIAEGALAVAQNVVQRIRELTVQGANDTNQQEDRNAIAKEVWQLSEEIRIMGETTEFNEMRIFKGNSSFERQSTIWYGMPPTPPNRNALDGMMLQVGANQFQRMMISLSFSRIMPEAYYAAGLGIFDDFNSRLNHIAMALEGTFGRNDILGTWINYSGRHLTEADLVGTRFENGIDHEGTFLSAADVVQALNDRHDEFGHSQQEWISKFINTQADTVLLDMSMIRAALGAYQNRLEFKIQNLDNQAENVSASESRIRDADMAREMTTFTRNNILFQASTAMLAQANALPNTVLQLIR